MEKRFLPGAEVEIDSRRSLKKTPSYLLGLLSLFTAVLLIAIPAGTLIAAEEKKPTIHSYYNPPKYEEYILMCLLGCIIFAAITIPAMVMMQKKARITASAKRTYLVLKDGVFCGVPLLKHGGRFTVGQYFEAGYHDIVSVEQTYIDLKSNRYTTLEIRTNSACFEFAIDNSQEAVHEIRKKLS